MNKPRTPPLLSLIGSVFLSLCICLSPSTGKASTATGTLLVSATVLSICIVAATPLAFPNYDGSSSTPTDTQATITVTCSVGTNYAVALGAGNGSGATTASRYMTNGSSNLNYLLYTNSNRTTLWGDGNNSTSTVSGTAGLLPAALTVYGRIPISQFVTQGAYLDSVTITVTY